MRKKFITLVVICAMSLSSCTDQNYDLSDIDTTAQFNANDLVIPVNMDDITLRSVLDLKETSKIKEINGVYAIVENGTFKSNAVNVPSFKTTVPDIAPITATLNLKTLSLAKSLKGSVQPLAYYELPDKSTSFSIETNNVPNQIIEIDSVAVKGTILSKIKVDGLEAVLKQVRFENIKLVLVKGLSLSKILVNDNEVSNDCYDASNGILDLSGSTIFSKQNLITISVSMDGIDADKAELEFDSPKFKIDCECKLIDGRVSVYSEDFKSAQEISLPQELNYRCDMEFSEIEVESFSGRIQYDLTGFNINPVELNDIPDLLNQPETDIRIVNPQIYLDFNNPLIEAGYSLSASTGLTLTANRPGQPSIDYTIDADEEIEADEAKNLFVLSPEDPKGEHYPGYEHAEHIGFEALSDVVSGKGLPKSISVTADNPQLKNQPVTNFKLGMDINSVNGSYLLYAPLNLKEGTLISYTDTIDGWNDEDVDAIAVEKLTINVNVTTDVTMNLDLVIYPVVIKDGKSVVDRNISGKAVIPASAKAAPVSIVMNGEISHLDGICLVAKLASTEKGKTLAPDMHINLSDLKAKVTGYYEKEL